MLRYSIVRLAQSVVALIGVSIIVFSLAKFTDDLDYPPCSECDAVVLIPTFGIWSDPLYIQYFTFLKHAVQGEFGPSYKWAGRTAMEMVLLHFPVSLQLAVVLIGATLLLAVPIGVISAVKKDTILDAIVRGVARFGQSIPPFWLGIMLIWIFAVHLGWFPTAGRGGLSHLMLPAIALGMYSVAAVIRLTRSAMLDALDSNYIKMARITGLPEWKVVWKHGLANATTPVLAAFPALAMLYIVNAVAIELVFAWPGVGLLALVAANANEPDHRTFFAAAMFVSVLFIGITMLVDILLAYIDPRFRNTQGSVVPTTHTLLQ